MLWIDGAEETDIKQPRTCETPSRGYFTDFEDSERRHKAGQRQTLCGECKLFRWNLCEKGYAIPAPDLREPKKRKRGTP